MMLTIKIYISLNLKMETVQIGSASKIFNAKHYLDDFSLTFFGVDFLMLLKISLSNFFR